MEMIERNNTISSHPSHSVITSPEAAKQHLCGRIFCIVDVYDALTSDRPYRPAGPRDKALEHIRKLSGRHFEPGVVEAFLEMVGETELRF